MKVLGRDCGCDARREVMFESGAGKTDLIIIGVSVALLLLAWRMKP